MKIFAEIQAQYSPPMPARPPRRINYRKLAALSSLGLMLPFSIAVGLFLGYLLDKLLGTHPWLLAIFTLLGVASGEFPLKFSVFPPRRLQAAFFVFVLLKNSKPQFHDFLIDINIL